MNDYFNTNNLNSAEALMRAEKAKKELEQQKAMERQKKEFYDNKVLKVAEETRNIEKENLIVSKNAFKIAVIALIVGIIGIVLSLIALFK